VLTPSGRSFAFAAVVLAALGAVLGFPELLALAGAAAVLVVGALVRAHRRIDVDVERVVRPDRVSEGEPVLAELTVHGRAGQRGRPPVVHDRIDGRSIPIAVPALDASGSATVRYPLPSDRRGRYRIGPLDVGWTDALHLVERNVPRGEATVVVVHPTVHDMAALPAGAAHEFEGPTSSNSPQGGIAFHSLREYVVGDDLRLVHWMSTARTGRIMVRHNVVTTEPRAVVVLDTTAASYAGDTFEDAVRVAASLCSAARRDGFPLTFHTTSGQSVSVGTSASGLVGVLDVLAEVTADGTGGLTALATLVPPGPGCALGVVTGAEVVDLPATAAALRQRFDRLTIAQLGVPELRAARLPGVTAFAGRTSGELAEAWNRRLRW
jgi:uncharacterized protein (DUF58 family)